MSVRSHVAKLFPPPRLLTLPSAGVDISESSLKYIQFRRRESYRTVASWGDIPIPPGVIARGSVADTGKLADVLRGVRAACGTPYVRMSLPEERAYLFETTVERGTPEKDIRSLLEFRMEENVPLSPKDALFDYDIVEEPEGGALHVGVTVYAKETIMNYYDACARAGLLPLSFEVEADAIARAAVPPGDFGGAMILDLGRMRTGVGIVHRGALLYTSTIDIGGQQFTDALIRQTGPLEEEQAATLKNERGLMRTGEGDVYEALLPVVSALKDEIETRITYWNTRSIEAGERAITKIILCGGSVNMAGLPEYVSETLGITAERAEVWRNAGLAPGTVPPIIRRCSYGYATAIGLALRDRVEEESL